MGQIQSLQEFIDLLRRRAGLIAVVACLGLMASLYLALTRTRHYEAGAVLQVMTPTVGGDASQSIGNRTAQALQGIEQRLTTRENLLAMIERHSLFSEAPGMTDDQKVNALRTSVSFQSVASNTQPSFGAPASLSALIITARFADAEQAARVANDFAQSILDENAARQSVKARESQKFFTEETTRIGAAIVALEGEIAAFKNTNANALPDNVDARQDETASLETDLRELDQLLVGLIGERTAIENKQSLRTTDQQQLDSLNAQINVMMQQKTALQDRRTSLQSASDRLPEVERALATYDRQLSQLQAQYNVVAARLAEAETNLRLEDAQHSEQLGLLERALVPEYPIGGGRKKIMIMGAIGSTGLAVALAFLLDLVFPVVRSANQMDRQLGIRPVISIPDIGPRPRNKITDAVASKIQDISTLPKNALIAAGALCITLLIALTSFT